MMVEHAHFISGQPRSEVEEVLLAKLDVGKLSVPIDILCVYHI